VKVLFTHELFPPDFAGGGEGFVLESAHQLQRLGVDVRVLTTGDPTIREFEGVPTTRMPVHRYRMNLAVAEIVRHARDVDLIQTFNFHACLPSLLAARWLRKPVVLFVLGVYGDIWLEMKGRHLGRLYVAWERFLFTRRFSRVAFMSEHSRDMGLALGIPPSRTLLARMGLHHEQFSPNEEKDVPVLFVGKLEVRKGVWDVLAVAKALPDVKIRVVGWGPEEEALRRAAPPNVEFVGVVKGPDLAREYARASIFLLPSRAEGSPVALNEAMASGCAVVCTLPFEYAGAQLAPGDVEGLVRAVRRLASDPQEARALGARNVELARGRSWEAFAETLYATYREVLGR
jgi:glycosyltransferase involved in cell wall biosynthesis